MSVWGSFLFLRISKLVLPSCSTATVALAVAVTPPLLRRHTRRCRAAALAVVAFTVVAPPRRLLSRRLAYRRRALVALPRPPRLLSPSRHRVYHGVGIWFLALLVLAIIFRNYYMVTVGNKTLVTSEGIGHKYVLVLSHYLLYNRLLS